MGTGGKRGRAMRWLLGSTMLAAAQGVAWAAADRPAVQLAQAADEVHQFSVPAKPLGQAITDVGAVGGWSIVFADFPELQEQKADEPARVPLSGDSPMRREWAVVAETPRLGICLAGWEPPGQEGVSDRHRAFEVVWTVDSQATRQALRICAEVAGAAGLARAPDLLRELDEDPVVARADPVRASALFNRAIGYTDRAHFAGF